jgi:hypothetical protein
MACAGHPHVGNPVLSSCASSGAGLIVCILLGCLAAAAFAGPLDAVKGDSMVDSLIDDIEITSDVQLAAEAHARLAAAKTFTCTGDAAKLKAGLKALADDVDGKQFQKLSDGWVVTASKIGSKFSFVSIKPTVECKTKSWSGCSVYTNNCPSNYIKACEQVLGGWTGLSFASAANVEGTVCPFRRGPCTRLPNRMPMASCNATLEQLGSCRFLAGGIERRHPHVHQDGRQPRQRRFHVVSVGHYSHRHDQCRHLQHPNIGKQSEVSRRLVHLRQHGLRLCPPSLHPPSDPLSCDQSPSWC